MINRSALSKEKKNQSRACKLQRVLKVGVLPGLYINIMKVTVTVTGILRMRNQGFGDLYLQICYFVEVFCGFPFSLLKRAEERGQVFQLESFNRFKTRTGLNLLKLLNIFH